MSDDIQASEAIRREVRKILIEEQVVRVIHATVTAVNDTTPPTFSYVEPTGTATVDAEGNPASPSPTPIDVLYPSWYTPTVNDTVIIAAVGSDRWLMSFLQQT